MSTARDDSLAKGFMWLCLGTAFLMLLSWRPTDWALQRSQHWLALLQAPIQPQSALSRSDGQVNAVSNSKPGSAHASFKASNPKKAPYSSLMSITVDLSERRAYLYRLGKLQASYPVAIGQVGWETPVGTYEVTQMQRNPTWQHPITGALIPPGAHNPLGKRWIGFSLKGQHAIGFHGTNQSNSVGQAASHGCLRMLNQDIADLYDRIAIGTPVIVKP